MSLGRVTVFYPQDTRSVSRPPSWWLGVPLPIGTSAAAIGDALLYLARLTDNLQGFIRMLVLLTDIVQSRSISRYQDVLLPPPASHDNNAHLHRAFETSYYVVNVVND